MGAPLNRKATRVVAEITKDTLFYDQSNGGVTVSGGEPLMQPSFLMALLDACGEKGIHRTVDTSGYADTQTLLETASRTDLFLFDLKHMDPEKHFTLSLCGRCQIQKLGPGKKGLRGAASLRGCLRIRCPAFRELSFSGQNRRIDSDSQNCEASPRKF